MANRNTKRVQIRLRAARLRHGQACVEDVDYRAQRQLDKGLFQQLATGRWVAEHHNLFLIGPTGIGKSWLACALAHKACRDGYTVHYTRVPRLFAELEMQHGDGRFARLFRTLTKVDLLILDDWGPERLSASQRRDLMEIVEERHGRSSTLITSQLPVEAWHEVIAEPTSRRRHPRPHRPQCLSPLSTAHQCARPSQHARRDPRRRPRLVQSQQRSPEMTGTPPAPVGQQGPPARSAAFDPWRSLRVTRGPSY